MIPKLGSQGQAWWSMDTGTETNMSINWVSFNSHLLITVMKLNEENWKLTPRGYEFLTSLQTLIFPHIILRKTGKHVFASV
jgi:hypothetical protein